MLWWDGVGWGSSDVLEWLGLGELEGRTARCDGSIQLGGCCEEMGNQGGDQKQPNLPPVIVASSSSFPEPLSASCA